jgi:hypothetical protein
MIAINAEKKMMILHLMRRRVKNNLKMDVVSPKRTIHGGN